MRLRNGKLKVGALKLLTLALALAMALALACGDAPPLGPTAMAIPAQTAPTVAPTPTPIPPTATPTATPTRTPIPADRRATNGDADANPAYRDAHANARAKRLHRRDIRPAANADARLQPQGERDGRGVDGGAASQNAA